MGWRNGDRITAPLSDSHSLFINIHFAMTFLYPVTKSNMIKNQFVTSALTCLTSDYIGARLNDKSANRMQKV